MIFTVLMQTFSFISAVFILPAPVAAEPLSLLTLQQCFFVVCFVVFDVNSVVHLARQWQWNCLVLHVVLHHRAANGTASMRASRLSSSLSGISAIAGIGNSSTLLVPRQSMSSLTSFVVIVSFVLVFLPIVNDLAAAAIHFFGFWSFTVAVCVLQHGNSQKDPCHCLCLDHWAAKAAFSSLLCHKLSLCHHNCSFACPSLGLSDAFSHQTTTAAS